MPLGPARRVVEPGPVEHQMAFASRGVLQEDLERLHAAAGQDIPVLFGQERPHLVGKDLAGGQPQGALDGNAEEGLEGPVDADVVAVGILDVNGVDRGVHEAFLKGKLLGQLRFDLPPGGDVLGHGQQALGPARRIAHQGDVDAAPDLAAVRTQIAFFPRHRIGLPGLQSGQQGPVGLPIVRVGDLGVGTADEVQGRPARHAGEPFVDLQVAAFGALPADADPGLLEHGPEPALRFR